MKIAFDESLIELKESLLFYVDFTDDEEFKTILKYAVQAISALEEEKKELVYGLKPFALMADVMEKRQSEGKEVLPIVLELYRRARALVKDNDGEK